MLAYLPPVLRQVLEFGWIMTAEQPEFDRLYRSLESLLDNQFFDTLDEVGVTRYEKLLGLTIRAGDTLETRRFRVKTKFNEHLPFTIRTLRQQLAALCGEDGYTLTLLHDQYRLLVQMDLAAKGNYETVWEMLERVVPANLALDLTLRTDLPGSVCLAGVIQTAKTITLRQGAGAEVNHGI